MTAVRPVRVSGPTIVVVAVGFALFGVARTTGSGWLLVLLALLAAVVVVGVVAPAISLARVVIDVDAPVDATAGKPMRVTLTVRRAGLGAVQLQPVSPTGAKVRADGPGTGEVTVTPERRGVLRTVSFDVCSAAPLGLVAWRQRLGVALAVPVEVTPLPSEARLPERRDQGVLGMDAVVGRAADDAAVRTVREYEAGDPLRLVHWPATARAGEVMVKQLEAPTAPAIAIVADLRRHPEEAASRAAGLGRKALLAGLDVTLLTVEEKGPVVGRIASPRQLGRRLARAVPGLPPTGPVPDGAHVVVVTQ